MKSTPDQAVTGYRSVTTFSTLSPTRVRARDSGYTPNPGNQVVTGNRPVPPRRVTILMHCRCQDCRHWISEPHSECAHGIIRNGLSEQPEYPPDTWHYCALYHGPQISRDVWVLPKTPRQAAHVGPRSKISHEADGEGDRSPVSTLDRNM